MLAHLRPAAGLTAIFFVLLGPALPAGRDRHRAGALLPPGQRVPGRRRVHPGRPVLDQPPLVRGQAGRRQPDGDRRDEPRPAFGGPGQDRARSRSRRSSRDGITPTSDLVTTSGSGVDPDIAPVDAYAQVNAVSKARGLPVAEVRQLVAAQVQQPQFGFLGSAYINVLQLNEALAGLR